MQELIKVVQLDVVGRIWLLLLRQIVVFTHASLGRLEVVKEVLQAILILEDILICTELIINDWELN